MLKSIVPYPRHIYYLFLLKGNILTVEKAKFYFKIPIDNHQKHEKLIDQKYLDD